MAYRIIYAETSGGPETMLGLSTPEWTEEFTHEHQALGRARELIEAGEHHSVAVDDGAGNVLCGVRLQWRLGGFSGD